jgi:hypothetical protein
MRRMVVHLACGVLVAVGSGCSTKALQTLDGAGGGIDLIDASSDVSGDGGVPDTGGATDAPRWDVPFVGRRSFVVTSQVFADGGASSVASHVFTMMLDADRRIAITGTTGSGEVGAIEQNTAGELRLVSPLGFGVDVPASCVSSVTYTDLAFTIGPTGRLSGSGRGQLTTYFTESANFVGATMSLTGVPDDEAPTLALSAGGDLVEPWTPIWIVSSEPLPAQQMRPVLRSEGGDLMTFTAPTGMEAFVAVLATPRKLLRHGDQYHVTVEGITDFAGNAPTGTATLAFKTRPPPPLAAADGFESVTDATLGGAQVLSGAGAPTISGTRSLYVPPVISLGTSALVTQFALRLPIAPGDRVLRFSYRIANPGPDFGVYFVIASVGGTIVTANSFSDAGGTTTAATIGQAQVLLGPTMVATIGLPADAAGEIVFARVASQPTSCAEPTPQPVPGLIIDDLRAE